MMNNAISWGLLVGAMSMKMHSICLHYDFVHLMDLLGHFGLIMRIDR